MLQSALRCYCECMPPYRTNTCIMYKPSSVLNKRQGSQRNAAHPTLIHWLSIDSELGGFATFPCDLLTVAGQGLPPWLYTVQV